MSPAPAARPPTRALSHRPSPRSRRGRSAGGSGWAWRSCEGTTCRDIVFPDSNSAISDKTYRYSDHPAHVAAFRDGLDRVAAQPCDILLTPHPSVSALWPRLRGEQPMASEGTCRALAETGLQNLQKRLDKESVEPLP